ncbi:hypothetical protein RDWZM_009545 [Blomia tropicalis]|uniref:Actin n=1 Tax=Blomia tropicalis TaxID=40697 RepID=A0A9Q0M1M5_BLOTA|nr:hypothetical protein RDWZM_009545 [Blomia tropicalis]
MTCHQKTVIIDNGTSMMRVGFAGENVPRYSFPTIVGHRTAKSKNSGCFNSSKDYSYVGHEAYSRRSALSLNYPIERGMITNWNDVELLWKHAFKTIGVNPSNHPVLLCQPYLKRKEIRKTMVQVVFESLQSPAMQCAVNGSLAAYASCIVNGIVLDCGEGICQVVPIHNGSPIVDKIQRFELAGQDLSHNLMKMLYERKYYLDPFGEKMIIKQIKENLCEVEMLDGRGQQQNIKAFKLPDGRKVKLGPERYRCAEALFNPSIIGLDHYGIQSTIYETIMNCTFILRKQMFSNIILSGGSTMFPNFAERLQNEMRSLVPANMPVNIVAMKDRSNLAWIGGSIMASLSKFPLKWITKQEYSECGLSVIYRNSLV